MTGIAGCSNGLGWIGGVAVALRTGEGGVLSSQRELGVRIKGALPSGSVVARCAVRWETRS